MIEFLLAVQLYLNHINHPVYPIPGVSEHNVALYQSFVLNDYQPAYTVIRPLPPLRTNSFIQVAVPISARSGIVIDELSGAVLWERNADEVRPIASLTKLMTALIFLDTNPDFAAEVTIEKNDNSNVEGSHLYVAVGETMTVRDLFYTSLVGSANNATKALARSTGMSDEEFVGKMNERASVMGLTQTVFHEVTGLDPQNVSTAREYSSVATYAFRNLRIRDALNTEVYDFTTSAPETTHHITNTNKLLGNGELTLLGGKTGYLHEAGYTFACESTNDDHPVVTLLFKSKTSDSRFSETAALFNWVYDNFEWL